MRCWPNRTAIREEIMEVQRDLTALERRVEELEADRAQTQQHQQASNTSTTRQGNVILELRRQVEDLDNRGMRNNICIRGLPESAEESFTLKDIIMRKARPQQAIDFLNAQVSLFQDLSSLTLEARRALRWLTRLLQEKRIPYKWGFSFSLQARVDNAWHVVR
ncbi:Hypothetical predicted protein [Pelobates cultripes]|uniref:Uncharacterized protein n=1 Tax=Pelobates cultripes TaxID=61616 RepID=A0AAD1SYH4_PELCU|nr:Hypothetical predicted protein [Pelobates cultripes]